MTHMTPKLLFFGSAAAEGVPALFCNCRVCREAAARGGPEIRSRTSYNFGGAVQIDFGPDSLQAWQRYRNVMCEVRHIVVTHAHEDHLQPSDLLYHGLGFASVPYRDGPLTIHGTAPTRARMEREMWLRPGESLDHRMEESKLVFHEFHPFEEFELPDCNAVVRTFAADHAPALDPCLVMVTMNGRTVFVGNDSGVFPETTWNALEPLRGKVEIDVAVLDDTGALLGMPESPSSAPPYERNHMSAPAVIRTFDRLASAGLLAPDCIRAVNHFSHNGGATHRELRDFWEKRGIVVGHDGLSL